MDKVCTKCGVSQNIEKYSFADKPKNLRRGDCKSCERVYKENNKDRLREIQKVWCANNPDKIKITEKKTKAKNRDKIRTRKKLYALKNKEKIKTTQAEFRKTHREYLLQYHKIYKAQRNITDPTFKLRMMVSGSIGKAMKKNNSKKNGSCLAYLPYSIAELRTYIENLFEPWMTWKNHGEYRIKTWDDNDQSTWKWQLDHIIPHSDLPYTSMTDENFQKAWSLSNLRPYSAKLNHDEGVKRLRHNRM